MLELTIRLAFSLAVVVGLLMLLARFGAKRFRGSKDALIRVVHRQHLSRGSSVSIVAVGSRVLVLGTTEHQVRVLAELDPDEVAEHLDGGLTDGEVLALTADAEHDPTAPAVPPRAVAARSSHRTGGPLTGSVLSVDTWRQALAATRRTS